MLDFVVRLIIAEAIEEAVVLVIADVRLGFVVALIIAEAIEEVDVLAISDAEETFGGNWDNFSFY